MAIEKMIAYYQNLGWDIAYRPGAVIAIWHGEYGYGYTEVNLTEMLEWLSRAS